MNADRTRSDVANPSSRRVAAIDCGTNSIRLLIAAESAPGEFVDVTRRAGAYFRRV